LFSSEGTAVTQEKTSPLVVLPTLNPDGTRRRIHPEPRHGRFWRARAVVAWVLIAIFVAIPFLRMNGLPLILLDIPARRFTLFGRTFLPTDGVLLMLLLLVIFVAVILATAVLGRFFCGWACPQTVYMEFLFRPVERMLEGGRAARMRLDRKRPTARRLVKYGLFALLSLLLGNLFLAYFVGVDRLAVWITRSPLEHPSAFVVMAVTAALVMADYAWFREQMCTVVCPYARIQSVLLDPSSLLVGYDAKRGEPRRKGKPAAGSGDCIDCGACVRACPSGIDIRDGHQLECIACTACVDACDFVMDKVERPRGLVRYTTERELETGNKARMLRPRVVAYSLLLAGLVGLLLLAGRVRAEDEITLLRGAGAPFALQGELVENRIRIKIQNRGRAERSYPIALENFPEARLIAPENPLRVPADGLAETLVFVLAPKSGLAGGEREVDLVIDGKHVTYKLLGPKELPP
jgi:cytochrome c oxidase accessory protein FixG